MYKMTCKFIIVFLILLIFVDKFIFPVNRLDSRYKLNQTRSIGYKSEESTKDILIKPSYVLCNSKCQTFVVDDAIISIKVFDRNGECIGIIGQSGHGPDGFQDITAMTINDDNEIVVIDYMQSKFSVFNLNGELIGIHAFPEDIIKWPNRIYYTKDDEYILIGKHSIFDFWFHRFTKDFQYISSFGKLPIVNEKDRHFEKAFAGILSGEILLDSNGIIYYVPGFYNGKIYVYKDYQLVNILKSKRRFLKPYEYEFSKNVQLGPIPPKYQMKRSGRENTYYGRRNYISGGLNWMEDGSIGHMLISYYDYENYEIGLELFSPDGSSYEYNKLIGNDLPDSKWLASSGKWFLVDRRHIPTIREFTVIKEKSN